METSSVNEERTLMEFIPEMSQMLANETNPIKLMYLRELLNRLETRRRGITTFKEMKNGSNNVRKLVKRQMYDMIHRLNVILSTGFDYYHASTVVEDISEEDGLVGEDACIDVLINEEHLDKLRQCVETARDFHFVNYDDNGVSRFAISYKNFPFYVNLIPFKREEDNSISFSVNGKDFMYVDASSPLFVNPENGEYNSVEYKKLTQEGMELVKIHK